MRVANEEQETVISFPRREDCAMVWTSDTTVMTKLDGLCKKSDEYVLVETGRSKLGGEVISKTYKIKDKTLVSFRAKKIEREARAMTDEQKAAMIERLAKARQMKVEKDAIQNP